VGPIARLFDLLPMPHPLSSAVPSEHPALATNVALGVRVDRFAGLLVVLEVG